MNKKKALILILAICLILSGLFYFFFIEINCRSENSRFEVNNKNNSVLQLLQGDMTKIGYNHSAHGSRSFEQGLEEWVNQELNVKCELIYYGLDYEKGKNALLNRLMGNDYLIWKLLFIMKNKYENSYNDIRSLIDNNRMEEAIILVHTIKGAAANLGIVELQTVAADLELGIKSQMDYKELDKLLQKYKESIDSTLKII